MCPEYQKKKQNHKTKPAWEDSKQENTKGSKVSIHLLYKLHLLFVFPWRTLKKQDDERENKSLSTKKFWQETKSPLELLALNKKPSMLRYSHKWFSQWTGPNTEIILQGAALHRLIGFIQSRAPRIHQGLVSFIGFRRSIYKSKTINLRFCCLS